MLLSTSSFNQRGPLYWTIAAISAAAVAILLVAMAEIYWRHQGHQPLVIDSALLWSVHRGRARADNALAFVGASRTQFGIHLPTVRELLPEYQPFMLAVNGRYPLATLRHLAEDRRFTGTVLLDVDGRGLMAANHEAQANYTDFFDNRWSANWYVHRQLLTPWQMRMAVAQAQLGVVPSAARLISHADPPHRPYTRLNPDRSGKIDFSLIDPSLLADHFATGLVQDIAENPPPPPAQWLKDLEKAAEWISAIEARGGKVIVYEPPVSGRQRSLAEEAYPRMDFWQAFINHHQLRGLNYQDEPALLAFDLPDESHVSGESRPAYTRSLIDILLREGWVVEQK